MKFFLDSAHVHEIEHALELWHIDGVTTNPRHVQVTGKPFLEVIRAIGALFEPYPEKTISVEINPHHDTWQAMVEEGLRLAALCPNFVIKVPSTEAGFKACAALKAEGVRANVTVCFSAVQALQAMRMGAAYISPFVGWKESNAEETGGLVRDIVAIRDNFGFLTEVLVAAVRNARQIADAAVAGADIVTAGFAVYQDGFDHPYTHVGLEKFQNFWDQTPYGDL
ncbi:MAG: transaldolase [Anaerolineae bacterium]|nr:transaldolase [Anaerolineae bacterium]